MAIPSNVEVGTRTIHKDAAGQPVVEQWLVHGAGHAWSSASASFTDPKGPDTARKLLCFFFTQSQCDAR